MYYESLMKVAGLLKNGSMQKQALSANRIYRGLVSGLRAAANGNTRKYGQLQRVLNTLQARRDFARIDPNMRRILNNGAIDHGNQAVRDMSDTADQVLGRIFRRVHTSGNVNPVNREIANALNRLHGEGLLERSSAGDAFLPKGIGDSASPTMYRVPPGTFLNSEAETALRNQTASNMAKQVLGL